MIRGALKLSKIVSSETTAKSSIEFDCYHYRHKNDREEKRNVREHKNELLIEILAINYDKLIFCDLNNHFTQSFRRVRCDHAILQCQTV